MMDGRVRWSIGSVEWQTAQGHPSVGTPIDVPLPKTVSVAFISSFFDERVRDRTRRRGLYLSGQRVRDLNVRHLHFVQRIRQQRVFLGREITLGLVTQKKERVDTLTRADNVNTRLAT